MSYLLSWEQIEEHSLFVCLLAPSSSHLVFLFLPCTPLLTRASSAVERGLDANPRVTCPRCLANFQDGGSVELYVTRTYFLPSSF